MDLTKEPADLRVHYRRPGLTNVSPADELQLAWHYSRVTRLPVGPIGRSS